MSPVALVSQSSWTPIDLLTLPDEPPVQPDIAGLIYPSGTRHLFSGEPESAKTLAAFALGIETIRAGGQILHLDFEMFAHRTRERLREMGITDDELGKWIHVEPETAPDDATIEEIVSLGPTLAIVDAAAGAYTAMDLDDNNRKDVERYAKLLVNPLAKAKVSSITIDHVTKNKEARGRFAIGSERKVGGTDVHLSFDAIKPFHRGGHGLIKISVAKDRFGYLKRPHVCNLKLDSDSETHSITWEWELAEASSSDDWRPTHLMDKIRNYLAAQSEPVSRNTVFDAVSGKRDYLKQALERLIADGEVAEQTGPNRSKLVSLVASVVPGSSRNHQESLGTTRGESGDSPIPSLQGNHHGNHLWEPPEVIPDDDIPF